MEEKVLKRKKNGMMVLLLSLIIYAAAIAGTVIGGIMVERGETPALLIIGIILFLAQVRFCKWWLSKHKQGPLETIWHKWTWIGTKK